MKCTVAVYRTRNKLHEHGSEKRVGINEVCILFPKGLHQKLITGGPPVPIYPLLRIRNVQRQVSACSTNQVRQQAGTRLPDARRPRNTNAMRVISCNAVHELERKSHLLLQQ